MAVVVQCYHCNTILELDEGFRGGVCRCSTCGSLLQVPKAASTGTPKARPAAPGAVVSETKRPANPNADPGLSRGQFDAAAGGGVAATGGDLGGSSSGLRGGRPASPAAVAKAPRIEKVSPLSGPTRPGPHLRQVKKNNSLLYVAISLAAMIVIIVIVVMVMVLSNSTDTEGKHKRPGTGAEGTSVHDGGGGGNPVEVAPERVQGFLGVPLVGKRIVLSVDGASSMNDTFDFVRHAIYHAAASLAPGQSLRVAVWTGPTVKMLPASGFVGKGGIASLQRELEGTSPTGSSEAGECMKASMKAGGDQVIFLTAKYGLDADAADGVIEAAGGGDKVQIDGIKIESADTPSPLEILAKKTGGVYMLVTTGKLEQLSK